MGYKINRAVDPGRRLSSITDSGTTLESYSYLGLGTVVIRSHPQPGVDLTYVKQTGESNGDAGDQYIASAWIASAGSSIKGGSSLQAARQQTDSNMDRPATPIGSIATMW